MIVLAGNEIQYALNKNGRDFAEMVAIDDTLEGDIPEQTGEMSVRFADMNGSGSTDIVWFDPSGNTTYLEIFSSRPNLLASVDNGIGKRIRFFYGSSTDHMARDEATQPWENRLPHPMLTLDRLETYDTLSRVRQVQDFEYRNGYYDGEEKQFRGFANVRVTTRGDASMESGAALYHFDVGKDDPYFKGRLLEQTTMSDEREISTQENLYDECGLADVPGNTPLPVRFICLTQTDTVVKEGAGQEAWVTTTEEYAYDGYGNQTYAAKLGITAIGGVPCGDTCIDDDIYEETAFIAPSAATTDGRWILRSPYLKNQHGGSDQETATEERTYYDGEPYVGLPLGTLTQGLISRVTEKVLAQDDQVIESQRFAYDGHGNVISMLDPNDHERTLEYDDNDLLPVAEQLRLDDAGHDPYALRMELTYDSLTDQPIESTAWMRVENDAVVSSGRSTTYGYDSFGRIVSLAKPGDSLEAPTQQFVYELSDPVSRIVTRTRSQQGGELDLESAQCFDGLGRKIQERTKIASGKYQVSGYSEFNLQGKENRVYQPYLGIESTCDTVAPANGLATTTTFDATGRPVVTTYPDGDIYGTDSFDVTEYGPLYTMVNDAEDVTETSPHAGTPMVTRVDGQGRTTRIERVLNANASPSITAFTYDSLGRIDGLIDAHGNRKSQDYDLLGRVLDVEDPDTGATTYQYDDAGNLLQKTDARNVTVQMQYDEANRPTSKWDQSNQVETLVQ